MKKVVLAILISTFAFGYCYKAPCNPLIQTQKMQVSTIIKASFNEVKIEIDAIKAKYEMQKKLLNDLNKKLQTRLNLLENSAKQDDEILFLLKKFNALKSINNNIESEK